MIDFDDLPEANRTLILATLQKEILSANCANIFDLARKNNQDIATLWRDICRRADQPNCTVSRSITSAPRGASKSAAPAIVPIAGSIRSATPQSGAAVAAQSATKAGVQTKAAGVAATMAPKRAPHTQSTGSHQTKTRQMTLVAAGVAILALGLGVLMMVAGQSTAPSASSQSAKLDGNVPAVKIIRRGSDGNSAKPDAQPLPPPPQGTIHRLDAISKAFRNH
jgi:hypothetical protein